MRRGWRRFHEDLRLWSYAQWIEYAQWYIALRSMGDACVIVRVLVSVYVRVCCIWVSWGVVLRSLCVLHILPPHVWWGVL